MLTGIQYLVSLTSIIDILRQRTTDLDIKKYFLQCLAEVCVGICVCYVCMCCVCMCVCVCCMYVCACVVCACVECTCVVCACVVCTCVECACVLCCVRTGRVLMGDDGLISASWPTR